jgi:hypothetical protein
MLFRKIDELWWDVIDQPDAISGTAEDETGAVQLAGTNGQEGRLAVTAADLQCDFRFGGEVNVVPLHPLQSVLTDAIEESGGGAVT